MALNSVILHGNLVRDVEELVTPSGVKMAAFTLAVGRNYKEQDGQYATDFFQCIAFSKTAENIIKRAFTKGQPLEVQGSIRIDNTKKDGEWKTSVRVRADRIYYLHRKEKEAASAMESMGESVAPSPEEEIPF